MVVLGKVFQRGCLAGVRMGLGGKANTITFQPCSPKCRADGECRVAFLRWIINNSNQHEVALAFPENPPVASLRGRW